jgi:hypothetical protein
MKNEEMDVLMIRIDEDVKEELRQKAALEGTSMSAYVRRLFLKKLNKEGYLDIDPRKAYFPQGYKYLGEDDDGAVHIFNRKRHKIHYPKKG